MRRMQRHRLPPQRIGHRARRRTAPAARSARLVIVEPHPAQLVRHRRHRAVRVVGVAHQLPQRIRHRHPPVHRVIPKRTARARRQVRHCCINLVA